MVADAHERLGDREAELRPTSRARGQFGATTCLGDLREDLRFELATAHRREPDCGVLVELDAAVRADGACLVQKRNQHSSPVTTMESDLVAQP